MRKSENLKNFMWMKASGVEKQTRRLAEKVGQLSQVTSGAWIKKVVMTFLLTFLLSASVFCFVWLWPLEQQLLFNSMFLVALPSTEAPDRIRRKNTNKSVFPAVDFSLRCWQGRWINDLSFLFALFVMALAPN